MERSIIVIIHVNEFEHHFGTVLWFAEANIICFGGFLKKMALIRKIWVVMALKSCMAGGPSMSLVTINTLNEWYFHSRDTKNVVDFHHNPGLYYKLDNMSLWVTLFHQTFKDGFRCLSLFQTQPVNLFWLADAGAPRYHRLAASPAGKGSGQKRSRAPNTSRCQSWLGLPRSGQTWQPCTRTALHFHCYAHSLCFLCSKFSIISFTSFFSLEFWSFPHGALFIPPSSTASLLTAFKPPFLLFYSPAHEKVDGKLQQVTVH